MPRLWWMEVSRCDVPWRFMKTEARMMIRIAATCILTSGCVLNRITPDFIGLEWQNREDLVSENLLNEGNPPGIVSARKLTYEKHLFLSDTFYQTNRGEQELRYEYDVVR